MNFLSTIGAQLLHTVLPSLATIIAGYIVALAAKQLKKLGIELTNAQDERLRQLVRDGILAAEEAAHRNPKLTSVEKNAIAVNQAAARSPETKLDTVKRVVDQVLPEVRVELGKPQPSTPATFGRKPEEKKS